MMDRRDFIKRTLWVAGAASVVPLEQLFAAADTHPATLPADNEMTVASNATNSEPYRKSMFLACVTFSGTVLEKFQALKDAGFDGVEVDSHMNREGVLAALQKTGLVASGVCNSKHWQLPLSSPDPSVRKEGIAALRVALEDAAAYHTDSVLLVPGIVDASTSYEECWERSSACIREVIPMAEQLGVRIGIENVWNNFLMSPLEMVRYVDQFNSHYVGAYFDVGNVLAFGFPEQWIRTLGSKRLTRIHIKEYSLPIANEQGRFKGFDAPLLTGNNDWPNIMKALHENYTHPWLTIEHGGGDSPEGLKTLSQQLDQIIALG